MTQRHLYVLAFGLAAALANSGLLAAPAPPRSLKEDFKLMLQSGEDNWVPPSCLEQDRDGKKVSVRYSFFCSDFAQNATNAFDKDFKKKPGPLGMFWINILEDNQWRSSPHYFRLEERDKKRYLLISGNKADEEIAFEYEFDGKVLKLKGGEKVNTCVGPIDFAGEYKRGSGSVRDSK
jgi:hypothetical protein